MSFAWAEDHPELHKVLNLFSLTELSNPLRYSYKPLQPFLQKGPQCGLVALAILQGNPTDESVQEVFEAAKDSNFTNHGEIFSVQDMAALAKRFLPDSKVEVHSGPLNCNKIKEALLGGSCLLVPYDGQKDNTPGMLNGKQAHWAVISGGVETGGDFYVLARHGKVKNVAVWRLQDLSDSNMQLYEVGLSYWIEFDMEFKLPPGGIAGSRGLNCKAIILK